MCAPEIRILGRGVDAIVLPLSRPRLWLLRLVWPREPADPALLRPAGNALALDRYRAALRQRAPAQPTRLAHCPAPRANAWRHR